MLLVLLPVLGERVSELLPMMPLQSVIFGRFSVPGLGSLTQPEIPDGS